LLRESREGEVNFAGSFRADSPILIIGYGNSLRCDDGVGCYLAELIALKSWPRVQALAVHQLTPELAPQIAQADKVIFIDAVHHAAIAQVVVQTLEPQENYTGLDHTGNPSYLLALAQNLYGHSPPGFWVMVPARDFEFGERFSAVTAQAIPAALDRIFALISEENEMV
jgi:hydrogenase maturation protease